MAFTFKMTKLGCLSLSKACFFLGLVDLIINMYIIAVMIPFLRKSDSFGPKFLLILAAIGTCTCLFMISGSILENRWSMLPHLAWELFLILMYAVIGVILLGYYIQGEVIIDLITIIIILSCAPIFSFLYWSVLYSRYIQIKENQFPSSPRAQVA